MSSAKKATIYVDVDDEITALIDKMTSAPEKIVALVLPKRATMLQSSVNMKLLKRSAEQAKKSLVLITSESSILPLAGAAGIHVAKTLQSKPAIPPTPDVNDATEAVDAAAIEDVDIDKTAPIGQLAGDEEETAEIPEEAPDKTAKPKAKKSKKDKKLKIPNFNKFRTKLIVAFLALFLLIFGWVAATRIWPQAVVTIKTDTTTFTKSLSVTASPTLKETDLEDSVVAAKTEELEKKDSQKVDATGEKNIGKKASGTLTLTNCIDDGNDKTIPQGTSFSRGGKTFVTTERITLDFAIYAGNNCLSDDFGRSEDVDVVAAEGGASFNIKGGEFNSSIAGIQASGTDMKGGTDQVVKVVSQGDIDKARQQLREKTSEGTVEDLQALLEGQGYVPFESTYNAGEPQTEASVEAGAEASSVTVTTTTIYSMKGALKSGLDEIVTKASEENIDTNNQRVTDTGINTATIRVTNEAEDGTMQLSIETLVTAGPQINEDALVSEILGKKFSETESIVKSKAGVKDVEIDYSPFYVGSTPNNKDKVKLVIENVNQETEEGQASEETTEEDATE